MERDESILKQVAKAAFVVGAVSGITAGCIAAELVQGADPVIFSPETGKVVAQYMLVGSLAGIGIGSIVRAIDGLVVSPRRKKNFQ